MDIEGCSGIKRTRTSRFGCKQSQPQVAMCKPRGCLRIPNTAREKNMSYVNKKPRLLAQSHSSTPQHNNNNNNNIIIIIIIITSVTQALSHLCVCIF